VQQAQAFGERAQPQLGERPLQHGRGQCFRHGRARQRAGNRLAQIGLRNTGRSRIDRREPVRQGLVGRHRAHRRVHHLGTEEAAPDFAAHAQAHAFLHLLGLAAVEIQEPQRQLAAFIGDLHDELAARTEGDLVGNDLALDLRGLTETRAADRLGDRHQRGLVLVAHRQVQHQVDAAPQAHLGQPRDRGRRLAVLARGLAPCRRR